MAADIGEQPLPGSQVLPLSVNKYTTLLHHFFNTAKAQRVGHVPAHASELHVKRVVKPFESLPQIAVDQTFAEIKHGPDCRFCLLQHNENIRLEVVYGTNIPI